MQAHRILVKSFYWKLLHFLVVFISNIVLVRFFGAEITGKFYTLIYTGSLAVTVFNLGLEVSLNYFLSQKKLTIRFVQRLIPAIVLVALIFSMPAIYFYLGQADMLFPTQSTIIILTGIFISGGLLLNFTTAIYTSFNQHHFVNRTAFYFGLVALILSVVSIQIFDRQTALIALFVIHFLFSFLPGFFLFIKTFYRNDVLMKVDASHTAPFQKVLQYSLAAFSINIIFFIASKLAVFVLPFWAAPEALGNFMQGYRIVEYIGMIAAFIYFPVIALTADSSAIRSEPMILFLVRLSNTFVLLLGIFILLAGPYVLPWIFGNSFSQLDKILLYFLPGILAVCSSTFFTAYFFGKGKTRINFYSAVILLLSLGILLWVLAKDGNVKAAALAFSVANLLSLGYDMFQFHKLNPICWKDMLMINARDWQYLRTVLPQKLIRA